MHAGKDQENQEAGRALAAPEAEESDAQGHHSINDEGSSPAAVSPGLAELASSASSQPNSTNSTSPKAPGM